MKSRLFPLLFIALALLPFPAAAAEPPVPFQKVGNCVWKADPWNDGDSFHVVVPNGNPAIRTATVEVIVRLYFVDTPEAEATYEARIEDQAAYFGISYEQALQLAQEAATFTEKRLAKPFAIWTRGSPAMGISTLRRIYSFVVTANGEDLNAALVCNGLARIHGSKTTLPTGEVSKDYIARLTELEKVAKAQKLGGWRFAAQTAAPSQKPSSPPASVSPVTSAAPYAASKKSDVFHKADCASIGRIAEKNLVRYGSREEAIQSGKTPCSICKP